MLLIHSCPLQKCVALIVVGAFLFGLVGCVPPESTDESDEERDRTHSRVRSVGPALATQDESIRTVQLYSGDDERSLPATSLRAGAPLTLEFDVLVRRGRALSIYFEHADRHWERDLSPSRILDSYQSDKLDDYRSSQGTALPYVHYVYRFPNDDIRFRISGNYVLRITEQGRRDSVLFERPFFVTDETGDLEVGAESVVVPGQRQQSVRPVVRYRPPPSLRGSPFGYTACFVRNGHLPDTRCQERATLTEQPWLEFDLDRRQIFNPVSADYVLDLGRLRSARRVESIDWTATPFRVLLEPDYAHFSGQDVTSSLNGHIVVREAVHDRSNPSVTAEYVETTFAFVPPKEQPLREEVRVAGSFSGMDPTRGTRMQWKSGQGRYEGDVLLKQGRYQYFYSSSDPALEREQTRSQSRLHNTFTTFVYYEDPSRNTDRLLRVQSFRR